MSETYDEQKLVPRKKIKLSKNVVNYRTDVEFVNTNNNNEESELPEEDVQGNEDNDSSSSSDESSRSSDDDSDNSEEDDDNDDEGSDDEDDKRSDAEGEVTKTGNDPLEDSSEDNQTNESEEEDEKVSPGKQTTHHQKSLPLCVHSTTDDCSFSKPYSLGLKGVRPQSQPDAPPCYKCKNVLRKRGLLIPNRDDPKGSDVKSAGKTAGIDKDVKTEKKVKSEVKPSSSGSSADKPDGESNAETGTKTPRKRRLVKVLMTKIAGKPEKLNMMKIHNYLNLKCWEQQYQSLLKEEEKED